MRSKARLSGLLQLSSLLLVTCFVFLPEIHYALVYDDTELLITNPRLRSWSYVPGYFTAHLFAHSPVAAPIYYRPVFLLWFRLLYATLGAPAPLWHLGSILAHMGTTACVFVLLRRLTGNVNGAALAAALFAIHPIQTETVAWVSSSGDLLLTSFLVLCVYFYAGRKCPISVPSIVFAALAMLVKEPGIVAPVLIFAYEWTQSRFKNAVMSAVPYAIPVLLYLALRVNALGELTSGVNPRMSMGAMFLTWPRVLAAYGLHLVWPAHLSPDYQLPVETAIWPLLLLCAVFAGVLWLVRGGSVWIRFGIAWFAITLAPTLADIRYIGDGDFLHDRYLYLPSVGLALIAAVWFGRIRFTVAKVAAVCAIALVLCWGTRLDMRIWRDDLSLFSRAYEIAPHNTFIGENLATEYLKAHREAEALPLLERFVEEYPDSIPGYFNLGVYYRQVGNAEQAEHYFSIANRMGAPSVADPGVR